MLEKERFNYFQKLLAVLGLKAVSSEIIEVAYDTANLPKNFITYRVIEPTNQLSNFYLNFDNYNLCLQVIEIVNTLPIEQTQEFLQEKKIREFILQFLDPACTHPFLTLPDTFDKDLIKKVMAEFPRNRFIFKRSRTFKNKVYNDFSVQVLFDS